VFALTSVFGCSSFALRHSFVLRHSCFVIILSSDPSTDGFARSLITTSSHDSCFRRETRVSRWKLTLSPTPFPEDFAFRLSREEFDNMRSQIVTTSRDWSGIWSQIVTTSEKCRRSDSLPVAFTEQGVAMLSSVLRSARAVEVSTTCGDAAG